MKAKDILNKKFSILINVDGYTYHQGLIDYTQATTSLYSIINLGHKYSDKIDILRNMEYHSAEQKLYKERFPCWFTGGTFPMMKTEDEDIVEYSNILAIDIDRCDNPNINIDELKQNIFELPYVFLVSKSISGQGIYALILLEDGRYTKEYYMYISKLWKSKYNIKVDENCTNIARKRFISYDKEILIKDPDVEIKEWKLKYTLPVQKTIISKPLNIDCSKYKYDDNKELTHKAIWYLLNNGYSIEKLNCDKPYCVWYHIGCDFRHFNDGEDMFIKFSSNSTKYNDSIQNIKKKWNGTKIENSYEDVSRKWCGICKNLLGKNWIQKIKENKLI